MDRKYRGYRLFLTALIIAVVQLPPSVGEAESLPSGEGQEAAAAASKADLQPSATPVKTDETSSQPHNAEQAVSPEQKEKARYYSMTGDERVRIAAFEEAVIAYKRALDYWKHPRIYYNLGIALINLDRPVDAYEAMKAAQRSPELLGAEWHEQTLRYIQLLRRQIGEIEVVCDEAGARVSMNGKELFRGPGAFRGRVRVGRYQIVATKPGFLSAERAVMVLPDKHVSAEISMLGRDEAIVKDRRIERTWIPWTVVGVGAAVLTTGGLLHIEAHDRFGRADDQFAEDCPQGCLDQDAQARRAIGRLDTAGKLQGLAITSYAVGGAAVITGLALVYLNQPKITQEHSEILLTPVVSSGMVGLQGAWWY